MCCVLYRKKKKTREETHFSSLSSLNASFFCFLMSSKLRRASARSLTARSLSRRKLSHKVLRKERERTDDGRMWRKMGKKHIGMSMKAPQIKCLVLNITFKKAWKYIHKNTHWPYALPLCHYFVPLLEGPVPSTFGHLGFLCGLLQFLGHCFVLFPQHLYLLIGSFHVQGSGILFLKSYFKNFFLNILL